MFIMCIYLYAYYVSFIICLLSLSYYMYPLSYNILINNLLIICLICILYNIAIALIFNNIYLYLKRYLFIYLLV